MARSTIIRVLLLKVSVTAETRYYGLRLQALQVNTGISPQVTATGQWSGHEHEVEVSDSISNN